MHSSTENTLIAMIEDIGSEAVVGAKKHLTNRLLNFIEALVAESHQDGYEMGHDEGHTAGVEEGYDDGREKGRADGYDEGRDAGHVEGYDEGLEDGREYNGGRQ